MEYGWFSDESGHVVKLSNPLANTNLIIVVSESSSKNPFLSFSTSSHVNNEIFSRQAVRRRLC